MITFAVSLSFLLIYGLGAVYVERKTAAFIQDRIGPYEVGKWGLLQPVADILKLLQKEHVRPAATDRFIYHTAPFLAFVSVLFVFSLFPLFYGAQTHLPIPAGILWVMAFLSLDVIAVLLAGWASHSKFSLYGTMRGVAQLLAYEIPMGFCILCVVILAGTLNLHQIALQQGPNTPDAIYLLGLKSVPMGHEYGGFLHWNVCRAPVLIPAWIIFFICALAQSKRTPFDLTEAESELVAGYHTEYTGLKWAWFMLAEYGLLWLLALWMTWLFLGAGFSPLPNIGALKLALWTNGKDLNSIWFTFWIMIKTMAIVWSIMWIRWTFPRLRFDQLLTLSWKYLTPISLILVYLTSLWAMWVYSN